MLTPWKIPEGGVLQAAIMPRNINAVALTGPWASLKNVTDLLIVLWLDTAATTPVLALEQAKDAAGTDVKELEITDLSYLVATDLTAVSASELWNLVPAVNRTNPVATFPTAPTGISGKEGWFVIRVSEETLDAENDFTHVRLKTPAIATDRQAAAFYISQDKCYRGNPDLV